MYDVNNTLAQLAGVLGGLTYLLFFLLLVSANIALWKYIISSRRRKDGDKRADESKERRQ